MNQKILTSVRVGDLTLPNRIVMAPMTRSRATADAVPTPDVAVYYAQRASAGLIITSLIAVTANKDIPAYYVMITCLISAAALFTLRGDDHRRDLQD